MRSMNKHLKGLKVLPLDWWMQYYEDDEGYQEINPIIGRDGYYWYRKDRYCWFETGGRAWYLNRGGQFKHEIDTHLAYPNMAVETAEMILLTDRSTRFLTKKQKEKLHLVLHRDHIRHIYFDTMLYRIKALK
jgi:hypothetical protein